MKACNVATLLVVVGCVTLTSNVYAQTSVAIPMPSSPAAPSDRATPADKKLARNVHHSVLSTRKVESQR